MNWVDLFILLLLIGFAVQGYRLGLLASVAGLLVMALAVVFAWLVHRPVGQWLAEMLRWHRPVATAAGFFLPFLLFQVLASALVTRWLHRYLEAVRGAAWNRVLGLLPGLFEGVLFAALALTAVLVLPVAAMPREAIAASVIGSRLVTIGTAIQVRAHRLLGDTLRDLLTFRTIPPGSQEHVELPFRIAAARPDPAAEEAMLVLVNRERRRNGLAPLVMDERLRQIARKHSYDMLRRGYFAHRSPEGHEAHQRIEAGGVVYGTAGENLAFAPTVEIAHTGLMESPGHRANILRPQFRKVGIGALSAPPYGIMFTQNFTD